MKPNWPTKRLEKDLKNKLNLILQKYQKLGLIDSYLYSDLSQKILNQRWIDNMVNILEKVENSESIFNISKELTKDKNDQRVLEMFSEFDGAKWLVKGAIDEKYNKISYLKRAKNIKSPDFLAVRDGEQYPVEVKMLSPQDVDEQKFVLKMISKINNEAVPQLQSFFNINQFTKGLIFMWSHKPIKLEKIDYGKMAKLLEQKVNKPQFPLGIYMTLYCYGIWDFNL